MLCVLPLCRALTGAWIETITTECYRCLIHVAPSRARGLKHDYPEPQTEWGHGRVLTGAWIETALGSEYGLNVVVASSRARGLKQLVLGPNLETETSRPHGRVD